MPLTGLCHLAAGENEHFISSMTLSAERLNDCLGGKHTMQSNASPHTAIDECSSSIPLIDKVKCETGSIPKGLSNEAPKSNICCSCNKPIEDRFLMKIGADLWHEKCMRCCVCDEGLSGSCFATKGKLFCKSDCRRLYSMSCGGCKEAISSEDLVMTVGDTVYHTNCFRCEECGHTLTVGDEFAIKDNLIYCKNDYDEIKLERTSSCEDLTIPCASPATSDHSSQDDRKGVKRPRTILTSSQRKAFKMSFELSPKPCRKVREELSKETGLSVRVVQVWFQNQRAKLKKLARKSNPGSETQSTKKETTPKGSRRKGRSKGPTSQSKTSPCEQLQGSPGDILSLPPPDTLAPYGGMLPIQEGYHSFTSNAPPSLYPPGQLQANNCPNIFQGMPPSLYRMTMSQEFPYSQSGERCHVEVPTDPCPTEGGYQEGQPGSEGQQQNHLQLMHHMLNSF